MMEHGRDAEHTLHEKMSNELLTVPQWDLQHTAANYRMATDVAGLCKEIVVKSAINIAGKKYVRAEGWQAIATAHGCVASARDVERVEGGVRAVGEVRKVNDGIVIATAEGFVGDDEPMWQKRPEYAKRAMCQTRAISRACRSAFAHVVVLMDAGLSTTPAEEVPDGGFEEKFDKSAAVAAITAPVAKAQPADLLDTTQRDTHEAAEPQGWQDSVIHFGKNKGVRLGDLEPQQLRWYQKEWQPRPFRGRISDQDQSLRAALDQSMGKAPALTAEVLEEELEEVPF
jgi:hypothetical protein